MFLNIGRKVLLVVVRLRKSGRLYLLSCNAFLLESEAPRSWAPGPRGSLRGRRGCEQPEHRPRGLDAPGLDGAYSVLVRRRGFERICLKLQDQQRVLDV